MSTEDYLEPTELLKVAIEEAHECIVVTDAKGYIVLMNKAYCQFIGVEDVAGKHVTDVIENTRMHLIGETGKPEIADIQKINGRQMIANRVPIYKNGKIIAVLGTVIFQDVKHLQSLASSVEQLKQELDYYKGELRSKFGAVYRFEEIVGTSPAIQNIIQLAKRVAKSDTTVLITGESGTGKELFAHAIHAASHRAMGPFIRINCAAIPDTLLESELFGYEEGAFTGASRKGKKGRFELAHHGTILLDEIGDMPLSLQAKLLRVLQEKEVERVGGTRPIALDVRVITSTNRNLKQQVIEGKFREDLYYRLHVVSIPIPPLRDRIEDLPLLANNLLSQLVSSTGGIVVENIEDEAWDTLHSYNWPGNVRELRNVLERALHLMEDGTLGKEHLLLPAVPKEKKQETSAPHTLKESLEIAEREAIQRVLSLVDGNRIEAAKILDISKSGLYAKIEKYGL